MTFDPNTDESKSDIPPIRRPVVFYGTVILSFGLLGAAVLALTL